MTALLTEADKATISRITIGGLQELLGSKPELLVLGVEQIAAIYQAGVVAGVEACCEVLT